MTNLEPIELRARREAIGLSQAHLGEMLGVKQNTISQWESGKRAIPDDVDAELDALEASVERLAAEAVSLGEPLRAWGSDEAAAAAGVDLGAPASLHRVAMARARATLRATTGGAVRIVAG